MRSLKPGGTFIETDLGFMMHVPLLLFATRWIGSRKLEDGDRPVQEGGTALQGTDRGGEVPPVIDRTYPLEDVVEAVRYVETEQKTGNVVLTVDGDRGQDPRLMEA